MNGETHHRKHVKVGVPEIDKLLRKVRRQGGRVERGSHGVKVWGPRGAGPVTLASSRPKATSLRLMRSKLKGIGFSL